LLAGSPGGIWHRIVCLAARSRRRLALVGEISRQPVSHFFPFPFSLFMDLSPNGEEIAMT